MSILPAIGEHIFHPTVCIRIKHNEDGGFTITHSPMNNMDEVNEYSASTAKAASAIIKSLMATEIENCQATIEQFSNSEYSTDWFAQHAAACQAFLNSI